MLKLIRIYLKNILLIQMKSYKIVSFLIPTYLFSSNSFSFVRDLRVRTNMALLVL